MLICLFLQAAFAVSVTSFTAGSPISASVMNANFSNVVSAVNALPWTVSGGSLSTTYTATGINNASPVAPLDIGVNNGQCSLTTTGSIGVPALRISNSGSQSLINFYSGGALTGRIRNDNGGNMIFLTRTGFFGIYLGGDCDVTPTYSWVFSHTNGVFSSTGWSIGTNGILSASDARMKENVRPVANALSRLLQVRGVEFTWKQGVPVAGQRSLGVIAQEVEKVFPELVGEGDKGKTVAYAQLVAPVIEAMRELADQVKDLKEQNSALQKRVDSLVSH